MTMPSEQPLPQRVTEFLGLRRSIVGLLTMAILVGLGERMAERFLPIYLIALGTGQAAAGLLHGLDTLLSALYSFPGGYLSDRLGTKRALLVFNLLAMFGFLIVILVPAWPAVFVGSVFFLSWTAISLPATMDIMAKALPMRKRTMGVSVHSFVRRVPMALGPLVGGACIDVWGERIGVRIAFVAALALAAVAAVFQQLLIADDAPRSADVPGGGDAPRPNPPASAEGNPRRLLAQMSPSLKNLLISDILIRFCAEMPYAFVVVWCMKRISAPVTGLQFGLLTAIEMATAMAVYIPVAYLADRSHKKPFVVITFVFFTAFPLALYFSRSFVWLVPVFVLRGLKEFGEPTRKALIMDLAPEGRKAGMFGLYYLMRDIPVAAAVFGGAFLWKVHPAANLMTAFALGAAGTVWFALRGRDLSGA